MENKLFVVRKYIMARSAEEAIKKDKTARIDDVFVDSDWKEYNLSKTIGFSKK